jgi:predicted dehydrogenase
MTIRLIHVGVGGRGRWPLDRVRERHDFASVALVDVDQRALAAAQEITGLPPSACFSTLGKALATVDADAVVVITPPQLHAEQCLESIHAQRHVLVEKPLALGLADAKRVVREADRQGVTVTVCQNARYAAPVATIRRLVRERVHGTPVFGAVTRFGARPDVRHSRGVRHAYLWERGVHDLDTARALFDARPIRVWGHSFNPPWSPYAHGAGVHAWVEFEGGGTVSYVCTFAAHKPGASLRLELTGGTLELSGDALLLRRPGAAEDEHLPLDAVPPAETILLDDFHRHITEGVEPDFGGHANLVTVATVEGIARASDEGRVVTLAEMLGGGDEDVS